MKKLITIFAGLSIVIGLAVNGISGDDGWTSVSVVSQIGVTNTYTTPQKFWGFVDSIYIDFSAISTNTLTMSLARTSEQILSVTVGTADTTIRPRVAVQNTSGATTTAGTNALERVKLVDEALKFTLSEENARTNSHTIWIKISDR